MHDEENCIFQKIHGQVGHGMQLIWNCSCRFHAFITIITNSIEELTPDIQNWVFMGIVGVIFLAWYIGIHWIYLKKKFYKIDIKLTLDIFCFVNNSCFFKCLFFCYCKIHKYHNVVFYLNNNSMF